MTDDPGVLAREIAAEILSSVNWQQPFDIRRGLIEGILKSALARTESLSAPVEDEEKVCREILAAEFEKRYGDDDDTKAVALILEGSNITVSAIVAKAAMREYARRLRAPGDAELRASGAAEFARFLYPGEDQEKERAAYRQGASDCRAPVGVTIGEPLADARLKEVIPSLQRLAILSIYDRETETSCIATNLEDELRAVVAMLQANGVSGSPTSPKQTSEP